MDIMNMKTYHRFKEENIEYAHYDFCQERMNKINKNSMRVSIYTVLAVGIIAFGSWKTNSIGVGNLYIMMAVALFVVGWLAMNKNKYFNLLMLALYTITMLWLNLPIGAIGIIFYAVSTLNAFELEIIKSMDGYPHFSKRLEETSREYVPMHTVQNEGHYMDNLTRKTVLGQPEEQTPKIVNDDEPKQILLADLPKVAEFLGDTQNPAYNKVYDLPPLEEISLAPSNKELYTSPNAKISLEKKTDKRNDGEI